MEPTEQNPMQQLQQDVARLRRSTLRPAVEDADKILELLIQAREEVANATEPHTASLTMTKLQNPVTSGFEKINDDLKVVSKAQKAYGKSLDKNFPSKDLPSQHDAMAPHVALINRAIAMHLLREGQFGVASTFLNESHDHLPPQPSPSQAGSGLDIQSLQSQELQDKFAKMYTILSDLKNQNLEPAIEWARQNSAELEARGSTLDFELTKLQFIWLFKGPEFNNLPNDHHNGPYGALLYARRHFARFRPRHRADIQKLSASLVYANDIAASPYSHYFSASSTMFDDVATSFTREFCSLLGLSAESPLYLAVTAGAIALPKLNKYTAYVKATGTEWTTKNELAFETPLPASMIYHPIFVCPVSKEQSTDTNPPMMLTCGHVITKESLDGIAKGIRYKCPYCPTEGQTRDALEVSLF